MRLAIDAMGGDYAPDVIVKGVSQALRSRVKLDTLFLVGDENQLSPILAKYDVPMQALKIVHTNEMVGMGECGAKTLRTKRHSSISLAVGLVKSGDADAVVGAGNTGALVSNATVKLRTLNGVSRASIASNMPNIHGRCLLMDAGANPNPKPEHLIEGALMGATYAATMQTGKKPKVGIMSNGEEEGKGTELTKASHQMMKYLVKHSTYLPFDYLGYVEGRDLFLDDLQVCLTDGFTGNVVLKTAEGVAKAMGVWIKEEYNKGWINRIAGVLSKPVFTKVKARTSHEKVGGSLLLGVNGVCVIGHGSSSADAVENAIRLAVSSVENKLNPKIEQAVKSLEVLKGYSL